MSDWVRFHREIRQGDKRGLPRATRFIFMELSQEARGRKGYIVLPAGMTDVDAVHDILGGDRNEIADAIERLTAGAQPMLVFRAHLDRRVCEVVRWKKWNPIDATVTKRKREQRKRDKESRGGHAKGHAAVTRDTAVTVTVGHAPVTELEERRGEEIRESPSGSPREPADSQTRIRTGTVNAMQDGSFGMCVSAWAEGIRMATGKPFLAPRLGELAKLLDAFDAFAPKEGDRIAWARESAMSFAAARKGELLNVHRYVDWLNSDSPSKGAPGKQDLQRAPATGRLWKVGQT